MAVTNYREIAEVGANNVCSLKCDQLIHGNMTTRLFYNILGWYAQVNTVSTSTKGIMDPEGAACLLTLVYPYGNPRLPPVHKYSSLRSSAHRAVAGCCATRNAPAV